MMIRYRFTYRLITTNYLEIAFLLLLIALPPQCKSEEAASVKSISVTNACSALARPNDLKAASIWTKVLDNKAVYQISISDLSSEGYSRLPSDEKIYLSRVPGSCFIDSCSTKISANAEHQRNIGTDGKESNQSGKEAETGGIGSDLHSDDDFYCARRKGDCGAHLPIYMAKHSSGQNSEFAYAFDTNNVPSGFIRDEEPLCYGWAAELEKPPTIIVRNEPTEKDASSSPKCLHLDSVVNAEIVYSDLPSSEVTPVDGHALGATASLKCGSGYAAAGQTILLCTNNGWYPATGIGYCVSQSKAHHPKLLVAADVPQTCPPATKPPNANLIYSTFAQGGNYIQSTTVTVMCDLGYVLTSQATSVCRSGQWTPPISFCTSLFAINCAPMMQPANGQLSYSNTTAPFSIGSTATLSCIGGHGVRGEQTSTCSAAGWSKPLGACQPINERYKRQAAGSCPALTSTNGAVSYTLQPTSNMYPSGTAAFLMCNLGSSPTGSVSSLCQNGAWAPPMGTCPASSGIGEGSCTDLPFPLNGYINYNPYWISIHQANTIATLTCNPGFTVSGISSSTCTNSTWQPSSLGTCVQGSGTKNMTVTNANDFPTGTSTLECPNPVVFNGQVTYSQGNALAATKPSGTIVTLTCNAGYTPSGTAISTCTNGQWSPAISTCNLGSGTTNTSTGTASCVAQIAPLGATLTYSQAGPLGPFPTGTILTAQCTNGQLIQGTSTTTCQNGVWNPPTLGSCGTTGTGTGTMSGQCTAMLAPLGATMIYSSNGPFGPFPNGATVTATCPVGQTIQGVATASCINGIWSPVTLGMCTGGTGVGNTSGNCQALPAAAGGSIAYSNMQTVGPFPIGTSATLTCTNGGIVSGSYVSTCLGPNNWSPNLGTCTGGTGVGPGTSTGQCIFAPPIPLGATAVYSAGASLGPWNSGTTVTITCPSGGAVQGSPTATCTNGQWSQLGTCSTGEMNGNSSLVNGQTQTTIFPLSTTTTASIETNFINGTTNQTLIGPSNQTNGTGTGNSPCYSALAIEHAIINYTPPNGQPQVTQPPFAEGTSATLSCEAGFHLDGGLGTSICQAAEWNPSSVALAHCVPSSASNLPTTAVIATV